MLEKFLKTVKKHQMIDQGDGIVIGISGGPDSVSLLHLLESIREEYRLRIYAVHLNHQFRGEEAEQDAAYVNELCEQLQIPCFVFTEDIMQYSREKGITFEEAGRERRYGLFQQVLTEKGAQKIAVAQNMDDQAETLLIRLMRGSGIEGLGGMEYIRDKTIIRPLLDISRREIEDYCEKHQLMPRIDKTNLEPTYTRNRVRLELIPYIEKHFNQNIKETLCRTANIMREDMSLLQQVVEGTYLSVAKKENESIRIEKERIRGMNPALAKRIIREAIKEVLGTLKNIESIHVENVMNLIEKSSVGTSINLPGEVEAILDYKQVILRKTHRFHPPTSFNYDLNIGETLWIKELNITISAKVVEMEEAKKLKKNSNIGTFDFEKIKGKLMVRNRKEGDRFNPYGMKGRKKLKDFFIDEKVSQERRDKIPLVCDEYEILWVVGYRTNEIQKIEASTKKVLVLEYYPNH